MSNTDASPIDFGMSVAVYREVAGLSQKEFAEHLGFSPQYVNDIERGRRNAPRRHLHRLADVLAVPYDYLCFLAGVLPDDITNSEASQQQVVTGFAAFRAALEIER